MEILVPIDITQEEKSVLAIFSIRQFFLVIPITFVMIAFIMWGFIPFMSGFSSFLVRLIISLIVVGIAILLAYFKIDKYEMYLSDFVIVKWKFARSQKTYRAL